MMDPALKAHLAGGLTTVCHCWSIERRDGAVLGFTDHDGDLSFEGVIFAADTGLTASAIERDAGLSVDNSEAVGAFSAASLDPADIRAGRYDGAKVTCWLANWADLAQRHILFAGHLGEITHDGQVFQAELRGLSEPLNQFQGRQYRPTCGAVLGDEACGVDLSQPVYFVDVTVTAVDADGRIGVTGGETYPDGWFQHGRVEMSSGQAAGLVRSIREDAVTATGRDLALWALSGAEVAPGDTVRLVAGCDRRFETCRVKFSNVLNFRGFPDLPGDDWLVATPKDGALNDGGSLKG